MTDETWAKMAPVVAKGIRKMEDFCDHPNCWVVCSLDGFSSHVNVTSALKVEGDTSHVNQAYDQSVEKADKDCMPSLIDSVRGPIKGIMTQWQVIAICCIALKNVSPQTWINSFKKVNMHPHHRVPIDVWLRQIDDKVGVGERFFKKRTSLFDAMPSIETINGFDSRVGEDGFVWTKEDAQRLLKFTPLDDFKLRACYMPTKVDGSVFVDPTRIVNASQHSVSDAEAKDVFKWATWHPATMMDVYCKTKERQNSESVAWSEARTTYFNHITNFETLCHEITGRKMKS
jgi:hypothetical protein